MNSNDYSYNLFKCLLNIGLKVAKRAAKELENGDLNISKGKDISISHKNEEFGTSFNFQIFVSLRMRTSHSS